MSCVGRPRIEKETPPRALCCGPLCGERPYGYADIGWNCIAVKLAQQDRKILTVPEGKINVREKGRTRVASGLFARCVDCQLSQLLIAYTAGPLPQDRKAV
jgi:hypothetical protein